MKLTDVIRHGSNVHNRLVTQAREATSPQIIVARTEEAAAQTILLGIARQHLRPESAPAIAEAMVKRMNPAAIAIEPQRAGRHICQALYDESGQLLDECARCGRNFRDTSVHEALAHNVEEESKP